METIELGALDEPDWMNILFIPFWIFFMLVVAVFGWLISKPKKAKKERK